MGEFLSSVGKAIGELLLRTVNNEFSGGFLMGFLFCLCGMFVIVYFVVRIIRSELSRKDTEHNEEKELLLKMNINDKVEKMEKVLERIENTLKKKS